MREGEPRLQYKDEGKCILIVVDWHEADEHKYKSIVVQKSELGITL